MGAHSKDGTEAAVMNAILTKESKMKLFTTSRGDAEQHVVVCALCEKAEKYGVDDSTTAQMCDSDIPCEYCGEVDRRPPLSRVWGAQDLII